MNKKPMTAQQIQAEKESLAKILDGIRGGMPDNRIGRLSTVQTDRGDFRFKEDRQTK